jgi:hypothetical protein
MGMGMGVNPYPLVYMGNPMRLFLCRGYGYGVVIPGGYLLIAISTPEAGTSVEYFLYFHSTSKLTSFIFYLG